MILHKDDRLPLVAVNLWYHVGAADDGPGRYGYAHLFEHMMLQGSRDLPGDPFSVLEAAGATGINGNTDLDRTTYLEDMPPNRLELALWLESDRMGYLLDTLDQAKLTNQIAVVRNERRESREAAPYGMAQEELLHLLFPEAHPYRAGILGSHEDINGANLDGMREFFKQFYGPNNASLSIAGNIDLRRTRAMIEKYFGTLPAGPEPPGLTAPVEPLSTEKRSVLTDSRRAAPGVHGLGHAGGLRAGRRRGDGRRPDARGRAFEPAVRAAGVRPQDRPIGVRHRSARWLRARYFRSSPPPNPATPRRSWRRRSRARSSCSLSDGTFRSGDRIDQDRHPRGDRQESGAGRCGGRPAECLQPLPGRPGLYERRSRSVRRGDIEEPAGLLDGAPHRQPAGGGAGRTGRPHPAARAAGAGAGGCRAGGATSAESRAVAGRGS